MTHVNAKKTPPVYIRRNGPFIRWTDFLPSRGESKAAIDGSEPRKLASVANLTPRLESATLGQPQRHKPQQRHVLGCQPLALSPGNLAGHMPSRCAPGARCRGLVGTQPGLRLGRPSFRKATYSALRWVATLPGQPRALGGSSASVASSQLRGTRSNATPAQSDRQHRGRHAGGHGHAGRQQRSEPSTLSASRRLGTGYHFSPSANKNRSLIFLVLQFSGILRPLGRIDRRGHVCYSIAGFASPGQHSCAECGESEEKQ
jgi:hypothetical protein